MSFFLPDYWFLSLLDFIVLWWHNRQFEHGLSQAFPNLAGRGAFGSFVVAEPVDSPGNG